MSSRLEQYDILKGIGIILVMYGHALPQSGFAHNLIYGFHMPLFFFCSGCFFKDKPIWSSTLKDIKTLLIPWATFSIFLTACSIILKIWSTGEGPVFEPMNENCYILYYTIWFLLCLFFTRLLYRVIYKTGNAIIHNTLIWGGYFLAFALNHYGINIPYFIDSALSMLLFYHVGYYCGAKGLMEKRLPLWVSIGGLLLYVGFVWYIEPHVNIKDNVFPIYLIVLSMVAIISLYQLCCRLKSHFLAYCGVASLVIMGFHHPIYDVAMLPFINRLDLPLFVESSIMVVVTLGMTLGIYKLMTKYTPFLLGKF